MSKQLKNKIESMKGKPWMYNGSVFHIDDYEITENFLIIKTGGNSQRRPLNIAMEYLESCLPVEQENKLPMKNKPQLLFSGNGTFEKIKDILMDNITRVQENKDYVNQAKAVNASITNMLHLAKNELEVYRLMQRI